MKELNDVIKEINEVKSSKIYKEAMKIDYKQMIKFALYSIIFLAFLVVAFVCFYEIVGKQCIKQCQEERIKATDECMAECVLPDKSNYEECRDSRCDFVI